MTISWFRTSRSRCLVWAVALMLASLMVVPLCLSRVVGQTPGSLLTLATPTLTVVRIEEDWSLTVAAPNFQLSCPQISVQMAPSPDAWQFYQFHLNAQDVPKFVQGGLQLQAWEGKTVLAVKTSPDTQTMSTPGELVTWTQYLTRDDGGVEFGISVASSMTWGDFSGTMFRVAGADSVLDNYSPDYSVRHSGITYGVNLVSSLVLVQVRKYYSDGSMATDATPRIIYNAN
jgi:hypothetical protein